MASIPVKLLLNQAGSYFQAIETKAVYLNDYRSRYLEAGATNQKSLLFLHGLGGSKAQWRSMMNTFAEQYRVIAPDVPGLCLHAPLENSRHTVKQLTTWLDQFLQALEIKEVHIIAHSTACPLLAIYAANRDCIASIVMICFPDVLLPEFSGQGQAYQQYRKEIDFKSMEDWDKFFSRAFYQPIKIPNVIKRYNFKKFKQHNDAFIAVVDDLSVHQAMVMPNLKRIHCNTLVLNADHDNFSDKSFHELLKTHLPNAEHLTLERCGHMAFIDRYEAVVNVLRSFYNITLDRRDTG